MLFQILFFITISFISLFGSSFIFKTRTLYPKEKYFLILAIVGLFSGTLVLNEYHLTKFEDSPLSVIQDIQKKFYYGNPSESLDYLYGIPIIKEEDLTIEARLQSLGYNMSESNHNVFFLGLYVEKDTGIRNAVNQFVKKLHDNKLPVLYLEPKINIFSLSDWESVLEFQKLEGLKMAIEDFNKENIIPSIIISGVDDWFHPSPSSPKESLQLNTNFFSTLTRIFEDLRVKIILIANSEYILRKLFEKGKRGIIYTDIKKLEILTKEKASTFISEQLNPSLSDKAKALTAEDISAWEQNIGFNYWTFHQFFSSNSTYDNYKGEYIYSKLFDDTGSYRVYKRAD